MGYFGELNGNLVAIKEICENIKAKFEGKTTPYRIWKDDFRFEGKITPYRIWKDDEEKGILIDNHSPSGIPIMHLLKELGPEGKDWDRDHTYFSYKELYKLMPKIPEILSAIEEHRIKIRPKINELNKMYEKVEEEHKIAEQAIIQFARS